MTVAGGARRGRDGAVFPSRLALANVLLQTGVGGVASSGDDSAAGDFVVVDQDESSGAFYIARKIEDDWLGGFEDAIGNLVPLDLLLAALGRQVGCVQHADDLQQSNRSAQGRELQPVLLVLDQRSLAHPEDVGAETRTGDWPFCRRSCT